VVQYQAAPGAEAGDPRCIVPREAIEKLGKDGFARHPIGSGPLALKSFVTDQGAVLERNPNYSLSTWTRSSSWSFPTPQSRHLH